jgi:HAAS
LSAPHGDQLVQDYLARLRFALAAVPADRREEIVGEIASHIAEERARQTDESDVDVHNLLERIGEPRELASAASPELPRRTGPAAPASKFGVVEILALILTPIIWPVGVILLWLSPKWRVRDKLIGTLLPPGGYPAIFLALPALLIANLTTSSCVTVGDTNGNVMQESCTGVMALPQWEQILISVALIGGAIVLLLLPVLVGIYLATRLNKPGPVPDLDE